jgi:hypothetical protein
MGIMFNTESGKAFKATDCSLEAPIIYDLF